MITLRVLAFAFLVAGPGSIRAQGGDDLAGLEYRATSSITGSAPAKLETRVTLFNRGQKPLQLEYGACAVRVHAFRTPAKSGAPVWRAEFSRMPWESGPGFGEMCVLVLYRTKIAPGDSRAGAPDYLYVTFTEGKVGKKIRKFQSESHDGCVPMAGYSARSSRDTHYLWRGADWIARPCPMNVPETVLQPGETRTFHGGTTAPAARMHYLLFFTAWDLDVRNTDLPSIESTLALGANKLDEILKWRSEIAAGTRKGPRIFTAGVILDGPKEDSANRWTLRTEAEATHAVDSLAKRGVDFIKTHNGLSRPIYFAILRAAKAHNLKVASHLPRGVPAWEAADSGASSIEHAAESMMASPIYAGYAKTFAEAATWWKSPAGYSAIGRLKRAGVYFTPTLALYAANVDLPTDSAARAGRREALQSLVELTRLMHSAGIPIMAGSDIATPRQDYRPGQSLREEMVWLGRAGLSPAEQKRAAGENIARWLGQ